ncbi:hypothetical protein BU17DRAFT_51582, partial [Hysterangium stoloniferum]
INEALKCDTPHWRVQIACVPCTYIVEDEQPLEFSMQLTVDGNESLKSCEWNHGQKDEQGHMINSPSIECMNSYQINFFLADDLEGWPIDGVEEVTPCVQPWANLTDERKKNQLGLFDETGLFLSVC